MVEKDVRVVKDRKTVARRDGLSPDFERGRDYEQQEAFVMVTGLLRVTEDELLRDLLNSWRTELLERLASSHQQFLIIVEETYLIEL